MNLARQNPKPIPRYTPLRRYTPSRCKRSRRRRGEPTRKEKSTLRLAVNERAGGCCELKLGAGCIAGVLPFDGPTPWSRGHLVHLKSRGAGGKWTMENCRWRCHWCHLVEMHIKGKKVSDGTDE